MKNILIGLFMILSFGSFGNIHSVTYGSTSNVVCSTGDTLNFYSPTCSIGDILVDYPTWQSIPTPGTTGFIGSYVIQGGESEIKWIPSTCLQYTTTITIDSTGMGMFDENLENVNINIYPNPVINFLNIDVEFKSNVNIFTSTGQLIFNKEILPGVTQLDFTNYNSGVYIITVGNKSKKILK